MSKIIAVYPTSGLTDRTFKTITTAFYDYFSELTPVTDFFEIEKTIGTSSSNTYLKFKKGAAYLTMEYSGDYFQIEFLHSGASSNSSSTTTATATTDIPVRAASGINGTTVIWMDEYSKGVCMVFGAFGDKYFLANSANTTYSFYYSDTGGSVDDLTLNFNGDNIGTGGEYIAQPYYHLGVNTGDIYTFDGGAGAIPWGEFSIGNAEFVRIFSNFALRLK